LFGAARAGFAGCIGLFDEQHLQRRIFGLGHHADVPRLVDLADLDLAVAEDLAVALRPADGFFARLHFEEQRCCGQLVLSAVGAVLHRAVAVAEDEPRARLAAGEAGAVDEAAALCVLADERAHLVDELQGRPLACFGLRVVLVHDHETHGRSPNLAGTCRARSKTRRSARPGIDTTLDLFATS